MTDEITPVLTNRNLSPTIFHSGGSSKLMHDWLSHISLVCNMALTWDNGWHHSLPATELKTDYESSCSLPTIGNW